MNPRASCPPLCLSPAPRLQRKHVHVDVRAAVAVEEEETDNVSLRHPRGLVCRVCSRQPPA